MAVVSFEPETFRVWYPAFSDEEKYTDEALTACFDQACVIVSNAENSPIPYDPDATPKKLARLEALYALTCHIATMRLVWDATQSGAVQSASEGSVSASFNLGTDSPEWWNQTPCGRTAWMILKMYTQGVIYSGIGYFHFGG